MQPQRSALPFRTRRALRRSHRIAVVRPLRTAREDAQREGAYVGRAQQAVGRGPVDRPRRVVREGAIIAGSLAADRRLEHAPAVDVEQPTNRDDALPQRVGWQWLTQRVLGRAVDLNRVGAGLDRAQGNDIGAGGLVGYTGRGSQADDVAGSDVGGYAGPTATARVIDIDDAVERRRCRVVLRRDRLGGGYRDTVADHAHRHRALSDGVATGGDEVTRREHQHEVRQDGRLIGDRGQGRRCRLGRAVAGRVRSVHRVSIGASRELGIDVRERRAAHVSQPRAVAIDTIAGDSDVVGGRSPGHGHVLTARIGGRLYTGGRRRRCSVRDGGYLRGGGRRLRRAVAGSVYRIHGVGIAAGGQAGVCVARRVTRRDIRDFDAAAIHAVTGHAHVVDRR